MNNKNIPPYVFNHPDNLHCWQACLWMIFKHYEPEQKWTWETLDEFSGKKDGLWTWPTQTLVELSKTGYQVEVIEIFDYEKFLSNHESYLIDTMGKDEAAEAIKNSDMNHEIEVTRQFLDFGMKTHEKNADASDIRKLLDDDFLIILWINPYKLDGNEGYSGHFILIYDYDDKNFHAHDPRNGHTGCERENHKYKIKDIIAASYVSDNTGGLYAVKQKRK